MDTSAGYGRVEAFLRVLVFNYPYPESAVRGPDARILGAIDSQNNIIIGGVGGLGNFVLSPCGESFPAFGGSDRVFRYVIDSDHDAIPDSGDLCPTECPVDCFDGNLDGCTSFCGDFFVDLGEECDDGNMDDLDRCHNDCTFCDLGTLQVALENLETTNQVKSGLRGKLREAEKALDRGDAQVAINKLNDFKDQVTGQAGNAISLPDAEFLDFCASRQKETLEKPL